MTFITKLRLVNFRNYADATLHLDGRPIVLVGQNGAGKTNILEAISQFGAGRGLRGAPLPDMTRQDQTGGWVVAGTMDSDAHLGVGLEQTSTLTSKRVLRIDGTASRASDLAAHVRMFWLIPAMDRLFATGASDRRRFLDRLVVAFYPDHGREAANYEKAMRERNALLERPYPDPAWADAIENRMATTAIAMTQARMATLGKLQAAMTAPQLEAFPKADLALEGFVETALTLGDGVQAIEAFRASLGDTRRRDAKAGRALDGPHRSDLIVHHAQTGAPAKLASTGQQKALLTAIILCAGLTLKADNACPDPLILLDEAGAHLDADRRAALFDTLCAMKCQAWMTGTDLSFFDSLGPRAQSFSVDNGMVNAI